MVSYKIKFCPFLVPSSNNIIDISFLIIYVLSPFTKNWNIGSIRECGMGSGFSCSRRQSVTAARRSSTMNERRRRVAPKTTSWSPPQLLPADQRSKDPRACSLVILNWSSQLTTQLWKLLPASACFD